MKTLEQIKQELAKLRESCEDEEQFIESAAVMYLSCASDREFLSSFIEESQKVGV